MGFREELVTSNQHILNRSHECRFIREVRSGSLDSQDAFNYAILEGDFVVDAARLVGAAVSSSPDDHSLMEHCGALEDLVSVQRPYLERLAGRLAPCGVTTERSTTASTHSLAALAARVRDSGDYGLILTVCFATEIFYLRWCEGVLGPVSGSRYLDDWVRMHTTSEFRRRVEFLGSEIDRLDPEKYLQDELSKLFFETIQCEIDFHDLVYGGRAWIR